MLRPARLGKVGPLSQDDVRELQGNAPRQRNSLRVGDAVYPDRSGPDQPSEHDSEKARGGSCRDNHVGANLDDLQEDFARQSDQLERHVPVRISDIDVEGVREVDDKLVVLARQMKAPIMTNDYNLNRVAEIQGVTVLNINELANAVKAILLPGETLQVNVIQEGKEMGQGVGYLDDGTMVVIEDGVNHLHSIIPVTVTKVLQTAAGRMIFARPEEKRS